MNTILPRVPSKKDSYYVPVTMEMLEFANKRCQVVMRDIVDGKPLTDVLIKTYLQGFIDCYQANFPEEAGE